MKKKKVLGVGIVGLGRILPKHLEDSIKQIDGLKLAAVCDENKEAAKNLAKKEKVPYYTRYQDLVNDNNVNVVSVLTPNFLHFEIGMYCAKKGKHCIMEKPIALNYRNALQLVNTFKKHKAILLPVLQNRYNPAIGLVKEYVRQGALGKILTAVLSVHWTRPQQYYDESSWKGTKKFDGGSLLTQAIHFIDAMQWILGRTKSVIAKVDTVGHKIQVEDIANAIIDLQSGTRVNFDFTVCTYPHNLQASLTILGQTGSIKIGGTGMNMIDFWEVKNTPPPYISAGPFNNHKFIYQNAVDVLRDHKQNFIKAEETLESLRIIDAILLSSKKRKEIFLK